MAIWTSFDSGSTSRARITSVSETRHPVIATARRGSGAGLPVRAGRCEEALALRGGEELLPAGVAEDEGADGH